MMHVVGCAAAPNRALTPTPHFARIEEQLPFEKSREPRIVRFTVLKCR